MSAFPFPLRIPGRPQALLTSALAVSSILFACQVDAQEVLAVNTVVEPRGTERDGAGTGRSDKDRTETLSEVVVNGVAERQSALLELQDDPKPITVVTEEDLKTFDLVNLQDVLRRLGNVRWNDGNPRTGSFTLRGLTAGPGNDKIDPSIGTTVDGVPYAYLALADGTDVVDVEQVNVTRGPQGTLGAKETSVGQINIITRRPSFTPDASGSLTLGENNALRAQFQAGGPIIDDKLAWRITATRNQQDGHWSNSFPDLKGLQTFVNSDRTYGRAQLLFTPTDKVSLRLLYDIQPNGDENINGLTFGKPTPQYYPDRDGDPTTLPVAVNHTADATVKLQRRWFAQQNAYTSDDYYKYNVYLDTTRAITTGGKGGLIDLNWNYADNHALQYLWSVRDHYFFASNDDGTPFDISRDGGFITRYWQGSQQLKFTGKFDGIVDYTAGISWLLAKYDSLTRTRYGDDAGAWTATSNLTNSNGEYAALDANSSGRELMLNSLARLYTDTQSYLDNEEKAAFAQFDWHITEPLTLTTGFRAAHATRKLTEGNLVLDNGYGAPLNPVSIANLQLGGFASNATTGVLTAGANSQAQLLLADAVAFQYFGAASTGTAGAAYGGLTAAQKTQVATAKAIRLRTLGTRFALQDAQPWKGDIYTGQASLSNKFTDNLTGYGTVQYGEKPGISQFNGLLPATAPGAPGPRNLPAGKEKTTTFEVGVRTHWFEDALVLNANVFRANVKDFQQTVYFLDTLATSLQDPALPAVYSSGVGNVPKVRSQGVELDLAWKFAHDFSVRFSGGYTDAKYIKYTTAGQPVENGDLAAKYRDISGYTLPNAPHVQFNGTLDYNHEVLDNKKLHASVSYTFSGRENTDAALSSYAWTDAYGIVDASLGFGRQDGLFDVNVVARNLLNEHRGDAGWSSYTVYQRPRWVGVVFSGRFLGN